MAVFEDDGAVAASLEADLATADPDRRALSCERAGREGGARCLPLLAGALSDAETRVRLAAGVALTALAERAHEHGDPPVSALAALVAPLSIAGADSTPELRRAACAALALCDAEAARPIFEARARDENAGVRVEAVRGLWRLGGEVSEGLLAALDDADSLVRYYALLAVDELEPVGFLDRLAARLSDERVEVAAEAAFLLAERGDRRATPILCRTLTHRDLGFEAARLLGTLGDPEAIEALRRFTSRFFADPLTRLRAQASLWRLGDPSAEGRLVASLRSWRKPCRGLAIEVLGEGRSRAAFDAILAIARDAADYHCSTALRALGAYGEPSTLPLLVERARRHADRDVREDATRALGQLGGEDARATLRVVATEDADDEVRAVARSALSDEAPKAEAREPRRTLR